MLPVGYANYSLIHILMCSVHIQITSLFWHLILVLSSVPHWVTGLGFSANFLSQTSVLLSLFS